MENEVSQIKKLQDKVEVVLRDYPETRNSDLKLTVQMWKNYFPEYVHSNIHGEEYIMIDDFTTLLPREDFVSRCRRKVQEKGLYLPTLWTIAKKRQINEDVWKKAMGYPVAFPKQAELNFNN